MASNGDDFYVLEEGVWQVVHHQDKDNISKKAQFARNPVLATKPNGQDKQEPPETINPRESSSSEDENAMDLKSIKKALMTESRVTSLTCTRKLNSSTSSSENENPMVLRSGKSVRMKKSVSTNKEAKTKKKALKTDEKTKAKEKAVRIDQKAIARKKVVVADEPLEGVRGVEHELDTSIVTTIPVLDRTTTDIDVLFECNCCYNEVPFDYMVQCSDGHLFCCHCLENYAKEAVYGHGKGELKCMKGDCEFTFPISQICRALPENLYAKYEERMASECLNVVNLENFVKCKFCSNGAILDPEEKYFACSQCYKNFCRHCGELYQDHQGLACDQVEKDEETKLRIQYEEKMAETKIRSCLSCKSRFTKESGCNKMTCRCGKTMCYVCRQPDIDYTHFCPHLRDPDIKGCAECKSCFLWSEVEDDDRLAIEEIKKEAKAARQMEGFVYDCQIGATSPSKPGADLQESQNKFANVMVQQEDDALNNGIEQLIPYQPQNVALNNDRVPQQPYHRQNAALNNGIVPQQPYYRQNDALNNGIVPQVPYNRQNAAYNNGVVPQVPYNRQNAAYNNNVEPQVPYNRQNVAYNNGVQPQVPYYRQNAAHNNGVQPQVPYYWQNAAYNNGVAPQVPYQPRHVAFNALDPQINPHGVRERNAHQQGFAEHQNLWHNAGREIPAARYQNPGHYAVREPQGVIYQDPRRIREPLHDWRY